MLGTFLLRFETRQGCALLPILINLILEANTVRQIVYVDFQRIDQKKKKSPEDIIKHSKLVGYKVYKQYQLFSNCQQLHYTLTIATKIKCISV